MVKYKIMKRFIYIKVFIFTILLGVASTEITVIIDSQLKKVDDPQIQTENIIPSKDDTKIVSNRFRLLSKDFNGYEFKSSDGEKLFSSGADISILHNFVGPEGLREIFEANCKKSRKSSSVQRSFKFDENGQRISERCVIVKPSGEARIIWTESKTEYWTIDATSLNLAKEFESSKTFLSLKSKNY